MIDQDTIDRILNTAKIEEVVGDYVSLRRRGSNLIGLCPFHDEKTPSFIVSPAKGIFKCFGCGKAGNALKFIMEVEQYSYVEALRYLAKKYNIEIEERELSKEEQEQRNTRESMLLANDFARDFFVTNLHEHVEGKSVAMSYFRERGFNEYVIKKFQLGYSLNEWEALAKAAKTAGYKEEFFEKTGLLKKKEDGTYIDTFRNRVMFPIHSISGKVVAFGGRVLDTRTKGVNQKYINSPESEVYHKSNELYGIYFAKQSIVKNDCCYLVEGYTDVISMHQSGIENVVASSGTSLTTGQIRLLNRFTKNVIMLYDGDAAGIHASVRGVDMFLEEGMHVKIVLLPDGEDPDSFAKSRNSDEFISYIEKNAVDFLRFKMNLLMEDAKNDPIKRAGMITEIVKSISVIPNMIERSVYIKECSRQMEISETVLKSEILKLKSGNSAMPISVPHYPQQNEIDRMSIAPNMAEETYEEERNLMRCVIRYGCVEVFENENEDAEFKLVTVAEVVALSLEMDNILFHNPIYNEILKESIAFGQQKENRVSILNETDNEFLKKPQEEIDSILKAQRERESQLERHFFLHQNPEISQAATELCIEKYTLCKTQEKLYGSESCRLHEVVQRLILELKNSIVMRNIRKNMLRLKELGEQRENKDEEEIIRIMSELRELNALKNKLAKDLGERVITKV